jgi:epoxyqueuosine reductase
MNPYQSLDSAILNDAGLNCHAVFGIANLAEEVKAILFARCPQAKDYQQLILIGHAGTAFWRSLNERVAEPADQAHPVDTFTVAVAEQFFQTEHPAVSWEIVYPGAYTVSLQEVGKLAGWHHASPFMVGVNAHFGSWFAYRALVLANTALPVTATVVSESPCVTCEATPCISACPARALDDGKFHLEKCLGYRQQADSQCKNTCLARRACPVGSEHRYSDEQMHYHYGRSMKMIELYAKKVAAIE